MPLPSTPRDGPLRPGLVLRIGIVGHRWNNLARAAEADARASIREALLGVRRSVAEFVAAGGAGYAAALPVLTLVSSLAEGADRLAAEEALTLPSGPEGIQFELEVVLPFAAPAYRRDFTPSSRTDEGVTDAAELERLNRRSVAQFERLLGAARSVLVLDGKLDEPDRYVASTQAVVDGSDLLIAVWNAKPASGPGGTANAVTRARWEEMPVIQIDAARPSRVGLEPGGTWVGTWATGGLDRLGPVVRRLLEAPGPVLADRHRPDGAAVDPLADFFDSGREPDRRRGKSFGVLLDLFHGAKRAPLLRTVLLILLPLLPLLVVARVLGGALLRWPAADPEHGWIDRVRVRWREQLSRLDPAPPAPVIDRLVDVIGPRFAWADRLATHYAAEYRSTFTVAYGLIWLTVLAAAISALALSFGGGEIVGLVAVLAELVLLGWIWVVVSVGRKTRCHERWIEYRALAERLRHLAVLWPLSRSSLYARVPRGREPRPGDDPAAKVVAAAVADERLTWTGWLLRTVTRELRVPPGSVDDAVVRSYARLLGRWELDPEIEYNVNAAARTDAVFHPLHRYAGRLFGLTIVAAAAHAILTLLHLAGVHLPAGLQLGLEVGTIGLSLVLPAVVAAIHGFLSQAEMLGITLRAFGFAARLQQMRDRTDRAAASPFLTYSLLGDFADEAVRLLDSDLSAWLNVYQAKPLATP